MQFFLSFLYAHYYVFKMKIKYMQKLNDENFYKQKSIIEASSGRYYE